MPTSEEFLAAAFNPIIGQPCAEGDEVTLNAPGAAVRIWARCNWVGTGSGGETRVYSLETTPQQPAFFGGVSCYTINPDVGDTWMGAAILYTCKAIPGVSAPNQWAGYLVASRVTPADLDQATVMRLDVYRTSLKLPLGEPCPTVGATFATYDAGTADLAVVCRDVIVGRSFYRLEITPTSAYGMRGSPGDMPDGKACNGSAGNRSADQPTTGYPYRFLYCAELDPVTGAAVMRQVSWSTEPPSYRKACAQGAADIEETQGGYDFTLACKQSMGLYEWLIVYASKAGE